MSSKYHNKNKKFNNRKSDGVPVRIQGANVEVRNDDVNSALRRLKKILETSNRQKELAKHEYYEKPSVVKKRERSQAKKRAQKERAKQDPVLNARRSRNFRKKK